MCRSIKPLFNFSPAISETEIEAAALQFVRKISGFHRPSKENAAAFDLAVQEIAGASSRLLNTLQTKAAPRSRDEQIAKRKAASARRFSSPSA